MVTDRTTIRAATAGEAIDLSARTLVAYFSVGVYPAPVVAAFAVALLAVCKLTLLRASVLAGQIANETKRFKFGGQVSADQFNWAGLGATDDGAAGLRLASVDAAIRAVAAHHGGYLFGVAEKWPLNWRALIPDAVRLRNVIGAGYGGIVTVLGDYGGGPWATDPDYATKVAIHANALLTLEATMTKPRIALAAGHHNTTGGNAYEYDTTGLLTPRIATALRAVGCDVRVITPDGPDADSDPGDGEFPGALDTAAATAVAWARAGWVPDAYLEVHTEGVNDPGVRGVFGIYPDWGGDLDTDARDKLIPLVVDKVCKAVGFPKRGDGTMSEKRTGVGLDGYRLGVFRVTEPIKADCTRIIVEYGAHSNPVEAKAQRTEAFLSGAARATAEAVAEFFGLAVPPTQTVREDQPTPAPMADRYRDPITGHTVAPEVRSLYDWLGGLAGAGRPRKPLVLYSDGVLRQLFDNLVIEYDPKSKQARIGGLGIAYELAAGQYPVWGAIVPLI